MFTGIIQAIGKVREPEPLGNGVRLTICAPDLGLDEVRIGDSIAVNGACMTVVEKTDTEFKTSPPRASRRLRASTRSARSTSRRPCVSATASTAIS